MNVRILSGMMSLLILTGVSRGQEIQKAPKLFLPLPAAVRELPPLPEESENLPSKDLKSRLLPGKEQEIRWKALTSEERALVFKHVDLNLKSACEFTIHTEPNLPLHESNPSKETTEHSPDRQDTSEEVHDEVLDQATIQPPPMQRNTFDVDAVPISLHIRGGNGVESPFYTPVAPFCYPPLYFEDPCLERYGDAYCCPVQSVVSGARFYSQLTVLPISMLFNPPCQPVLNLWADPVDPAWRYYPWPR
jgi:hypothetical protein